MRALEETLKLSGKVYAVKVFNLCLEKMHCVFTDFLKNFTHFPMHESRLF